MSEREDWDKIQIQTLIAAKVRTSKDQGNRLFERGQVERANIHLKAAAVWENLLDRFNLADIVWPESGGEGS